MIPMKNIMHLIFALSTCYLTSCLVHPQKQKGYCLDEALKMVIQSDYNTILHKKDELLLVANFITNNESEVRLALIPKEIYSAYLVGKNEVSKGFKHYQGVILLGYGHSSKFLELKPIDDTMIFLKPMKIKEPKLGYPPLPPFDIEPLVYSFVLNDGCFQFVRKSVADTLIN